MKFTLITEYLFLQWMLVMLRLILHLSRRWFNRANDPDLNAIMNEGETVCVALAACRTGAETRAQNEAQT